MSIGDRAVELGHSYNIFYVMKCAQKPRYDYLVKLGGGDIVKGFVLQQTLEEEQDKKLTDIYYALADNKKLNRFSIYLADNEVFGHIGSFSTGITAYLFNIKLKARTLDSFIRYDKAVKMFPFFVKDYPKLHKTYKEYSE